MSEVRKTVWPIDPRALITRCVAAVGLAVVGLPTLPAAAAGLELDVDEAQNASVHGSSPSLIEVVTRLCEQADVRLISFDAPDRTFLADYESMPLHRLLERVLRQESYMVGLERGSDGSRVAWLHVIGLERGAASNEPPEPGPRVAGDGNSYFGLDQGVVTEALTSANAMERAKSTRAITDAIKKEPGRLDDFLEASIGKVADELVGHPFSVQLINAIKIREHDQRKRLKLDALIRTIKTKSDKLSKAK